MHIAQSRYNPRLPGARLPEEITITNDLPEAGTVLLATPMQYMRSVATRLHGPGKLVACCKGVESGTVVCSEGQGENASIANPDLRVARSAEGKTGKRVAPSSAC